MDVKDMTVQGVTPVLVGLGFAMGASLLSFHSRPLLENAECQRTKQSLHIHRFGHLSIRISFGIWILAFEITEKNLKPCFGLHFLILQPALLEKIRV